jgi:hypothetical protein
VGQSASVKATRSGYSLIVLKLEVKPEIGGR